MDVIKQKKNKMPLYAVAILTLMLITAISLNALLFDKDIPFVEKDNVRAAVAVQESFAIEVIGSGQLMAKNTGAIVADAGGIVRSRMVRPGMEVQKGDILFVLENVDLIAEYEDAVNELHTRRSQVESEKLNLAIELVRYQGNLTRAQLEMENKKSELEAKRQLYENDAPIISKLEYDRTLMEYKLSQNTLSSEKALLDSYQKSHSAKLTELSYSLEAYEKRLDRLARSVDALDIRSPTDGIVQEMSFDEGDSIAAGQVACRVLNTQELYAVAQIPSYDIDKVQIGQHAKVHINQETYKGTVSRIDPEVKGSTVDVEIQVDGLSNRYRVNMQARVVITTDFKNNVLVVNRPANSRENSQAYVYVINGDFADRRKIEFGSGSSSKIEIVSGLDAQERIIIADISEQTRHAERIRLR